MEKEKKICIKDVYSHAIKIERKCSKLYRTLSEISRDKAIKLMFSKISEAKDDHCLIYTDLLNKIVTDEKKDKRKARREAVRRKAEAEEAKRKQKENEDKERKRRTRLRGENIELEDEQEQTQNNRKMEREKQIREEDETTKVRVLSKKVLSEEIKEELIIDKILNKMKIVEDFKALNSLVQTLNKCIELQKRMIDNYEKFLGLVDKENRGLIVTIVNEEKGHMRDLLKIKSKHHTHERRAKKRKKAA